MLTDIAIKPGYTTEEGSLSKNFYNPCLSEAIKYCRVSGYFSSSSLKYLTKGIENLISRNGTYQLLISNEISKFDYDQIVEGYKKREEINEKLKNELLLSDLVGNTSKKDLANLGYLIKIGLIDIKIGFIHSGLFHAKYGLIHDEEGNVVYFSGSANETARGMEANYETIDVKKSWIHKEEKEYILEQQQNFDMLWEGKKRNGPVFVKEFNNHIKFELTSYSKGKLIIDTEYFTQDSLVLLHSDNGLEVVNNLSDKDVGNSRHLNILKRKFLNEKQLWSFQDNLNYKDYEEVIEILKKHCRRREIHLVIADSVYEYIEMARFEIDEVARRGALIKNQDESLVSEVSKFNSVVNEELADGFSLRGIQRWVSYYMTKMERVANFSVPGSGKTAMVYGAYAYLSSKKINEVNQLLVIGPKNSFISWKDEFKKVFGDKRELNVIDIHSNNFNEAMFIKNPYDYNLILINYESLPKYEKYLSRIINSQTMIVFDEVHKIKNPQSEKGPLAIELSNKTKYRFVLTGTPIPNTYLDIWNFLHILYNDEYKDYFGFSTSELANTDEVVKEKINEKLAPFFWRVTKQDLNIPPANEDNIDTQIASNIEQEVINLLWKKYRSQPLKLYTRLIQFSSNPSLLSKNINEKMFLDIDSVDSETKRESYTFEYNQEMDDDILDVYSDDELVLLNQLKTTQKFEACISKVDQLVNEGKTAIVWCIFVDTILKVAKRIEDLGHRVKIINGSVSATEREDIVREFQNNEFDVLVTNPHTLAESVSLHMACHDAIYLEYSFNLTHMLQSRDRIHRLGLPEDSYTSYYYFMLEGQTEGLNTIDQKIYTRLKEKEEIMLNAVEGENLEVVFSSNEKEEILSLMEEVID